MLAIERHERLAGTDSRPDAAVAAAIQLDVRRVPLAVLWQEDPSHTNIHSLICETTISVNLRLVFAGQERRRGPRPVNQIVAFHHAARALSAVNDEFHIAHVLPPDRIPPETSCVSDATLWDH